MIEAKIADNAVSSSKLAYGSVISEKIGVAAITYEKLADSSLTFEKFADRTSVFDSSSLVNLLNKLHSVIKCEITPIYDEENQNYDFITNPDGDWNPPTTPEPGGTSATLEWIEV